MVDENDSRYLLQGSGIGEVLVSDLRKASREGYALTSDPSSIPIDGSRLVYRRSETTEGLSLVAVLGSDVSLGPSLLSEIDQADKTRSESVPLRVSDLIGVQELSEMFKITVAGLGYWRREAKPPFPKPLAIVSNTPVWDLSEVRRWHRVYRDKQKSRGRG